MFSSSHPLEIAAAAEGVVEILTTSEILLIGVDETVAEWCELGMDFTVSLTLVAVAVVLHHNISVWDKIQDAIGERLALEVTIESGNMDYLAEIIHPVGDGIDDIRVELPLIDMDDLVVGDIDFAEKMHLVARDRGWKAYES